MPSLLLATLLVLQAAPAPPSPNLTLEAATKAAEKGHVFDILLRIHVDAPVDSLVIVPTTPEGFTLVIVPQPGLPGIQVLPFGKVLVPQLEGPSNVLIRYRIMTPSQTLIPAIIARLWSDDTVRALDTPRDPKIFSFNAAYAFGAKAARKHLHQAVTIDVPYTTSGGIFLVGGLVGLLIGFIGKTISQLPGTTTITVRETPFGKRLKEIIGFVFVTRLPFLLSATLIGFGVLVTLIKAGIPPGGYMNAIAIGVGLGVLTDDTLIARISK